MKTIFFKITAIAAMFLASLQAKAAIASITLTNGVSLISSSPLLVSSLTIANPNLAAVNIRLYDNDGGTTNVVRAGYTNISLVRATNSTVITNVFGNLQTNNFIYLEPTAVAVAAVTNEANLVYPTISVPASTVAATLNFDPPLAVSRGLNALVLSSNVTASIVYQSLP